MNGCYSSYPALVIDSVDYRAEELSRGRDFEPRSRFLYENVLRSNSGLQNEVV